MKLRQAQLSDAEALAALRVEAMRESLEAVGRFDEKRARERFLSGFVPEETWVLMEEEELAGFYVVRAREDHLYLDHLYVAPKCQGGGLGRGVVGQVQAMALKGSPANAFYLSCGFWQVGKDAYDIHYEWSA